MKKKLQAILVAVCMMSTSLTGCTIGDTEFVLDLNNVSRDDVFSINGLACTKEEAKLYLCNYQNLYGNEYGVNLWEHDFKGSNVEVSLDEYIKNITITELTNIMCMNLLAQSQEIILTEEEQKLVSTVTEEYYHSLTEQELAYIGLDKGELEEFYKKYALATKFYDTLTKGINEEVSEDEARVIRVQQIYVKNLETANLVATKLAEGSDFVAIANTYNEAGAIENTVPRGNYPQVVDNIAFQMENNQQSEMITTEEGYYFIKCLSKYEQELTEQNKANILEQRRKEQFESTFSEFVQNASFELNENLWESVVMDTSGTIKTDSFFETYEKHFKGEK